MELVGVLLALDAFGKGRHRIAARLDQGGDGGKRKHGHQAGDGVEQVFEAQGQRKQHSAAGVMQFDAQRPRRRSTRSQPSTGSQRSDSSRSPRMSR